MPRFLKVAAALLLLASASVCIGPSSPVGTVQEARAQFMPPPGPMPPGPMPPGPMPPGPMPPGPMPPIGGGGGLGDILGGIFDDAISGSLIPFLQSTQIPKLIAMVDRLGDLRERLQAARDYLEEVKDFTVRDFEGLDPQSQILAVLFGDAPWLEDAEAGLEELQAISYTLDDIHTIVDDVYPGGLPYDAPVVERLDQVQRRLSTARNAVVDMKRHHEQLENDRVVLENLASDIQNAQGRRQLMQAQTRAVLHQTKNDRMLRRQIATLTNLIATGETEEANRRLQRVRTAREAGQHLRSNPWPELGVMPGFDEE